MKDFMKVVVDYIEELTGEYVTYINLNIDPSNLEKYEMIDENKKYSLERHSDISYCTFPTKDGAKFSVSKMKQLTIDDLKLIAFNRYGLKEFKFIILTKKDWELPINGSVEGEFTLEIQEPTDANEMLKIYHKLVDEKVNRNQGLVKSNNDQISSLQSENYILESEMDLLSNTFN
ncbi:hypothetical protein [Brevibacillus porteri]|uniref:hypothetical protein n=1 Tax=Brevibacillus porteri TaxID=2126350 RepID=UPI00362823E3